MADAMEQLYQEVILDHYRAKHGAGELDPYDAESFQVNPTCGDQVTLRVRLSHDAGVPSVEAVGWVGQGCSISQASLSVLNDLVVGRTINEVDTLNETFRELMHGRGAELPEDKQDSLGDASAFTGVAKYPARIKCALLGWMALRDALAHALTSEPASGTQEEER
ncbi:SUF system NifU family Fe-S cluster assembly protein [Georgenia sp. 311]|uniref:SUF system NifU family Fe-S cluster assembly protein n=1 Tax=Georgenia wutianyii TaxID=2585135 RepID=A0ABX5VLI5_9MICO|nr:MULTISPECIES: SUF system NifU family Fe-S cluster assembly protein [Georgenia]QDB79053.1 SUF system NifU family Fe-S cluster assembly protein [Georgenia wutianyii]TNC17303.1 SUF system NifU family Fe-S cluster assembly protein [Georgenia sp. 311]